MRIKGTKTVKLIDFLLVFLFFCKSSFVQNILRQSESFVNRVQDLFKISILCILQVIQRLNIYTVILDIFTEKKNVFQAFRNGNVTIIVRGRWQKISESEF